jgi:outer membrane protein TolC
MMRYLFTPLLCLMLSVSAHAHHADSTHPVIQQYIQLALQNNLVLKQRNISLEKSMLALKEARSYFLPSVNFGGAYQTSGGGRAIEFPVGDLLNPVYATLNQLTGSTKFPQINNVEEQLLPTNFYDVRLRTTYPIYNPDLKYNRQIKEQQIKLSEQDIDVYKRELVKDVKTAYYSFLLANEAIAIYESTIVVVQRGLSINQSLYANGKSLPAYVSRSESELMQVEAQLESSKNDAAKAKAYFNFLLNRSLTDSVIVVSPEMPSVLDLFSMPDSASVSKREELRQLETVEQINETVIKMNESFRMPRVNSFLDLGAQSQEFRVTSRAPYYFVGLQIDVPIFNGKRNLYKIEQSKKDLAYTRLQKNQVANQLELGAFAARNNVLTAMSNHKAAIKQVQAASSYFKLIDRGRSEGSNTFIEWLDARNQLTTSQVQQELTRYKALIALADYERQTASAVITP